jgi:hypothetical protein
MKTIIAMLILTTALAMTAQATVRCETIFKDATGTPVKFCEDKKYICIIYFGRHIALSTCAAKKTPVFSNPNLDPDRNADPDNDYNPYSNHGTNKKKNNVIKIPKSSLNNPLNSDVIR